MLTLCSHPSQADVDADGVGDVCVGDTDSDSVFDYQVSLTHFSPGAELPVQHRHSGTLSHIPYSGTCGNAECICDATIIISNKST